MSSVPRKRPLVDDVRLKTIEPNGPNERLARQHSLSESKDLGLFGDINAGAGSTSRPGIVVSFPKHNESPKPLPETQSVSPKNQTLEDWSPKGKDSLGLEDLTVNPANPIDGVVIPSTITYSLDVFCDGIRGCAANNQTLLYNDPSSYPDIEAKSRAYIEKNHKAHPEARELYFRIGKCSIVGENGYKDSHTLASQEDWKSICTALIKLWTTENHRALRLDISQDYFTLQTQVIDNEPFAKTIRYQIHKLMKSSYYGRYLPRVELNIISSSPIVRRIILADPDLTMESEDATEGFIQRVQSDARRLFLMFLNAKLGMSCLKELLNKGLSDADLPLNESHYCHERCGSDFDHLINGQRSFMAAEFLDIHKHQNFSHHVITPIYYKDKKTNGNYVADERKEHCRTDEKKTNDANSTSTYGGNDNEDAKRKAWCGSGSYSNVYLVNIDPNHHRLSKDRDSDFAVKEFKDRPQRGDSDFRRELGILDELRHLPNKHIVTHLATWTQDDRYYMLFPYAKCNLREYMERVTFGGPDNENILWLLKQLRGLAKAIRTIHNLSTRETPKPTPSLAPPNLAQEKKSGWHHDLKPENILYYPDPDYNIISSNSGTFRIADFGAGKIHTYQSRSIGTQSPNGTQTYEPPEAKSEGATSRPYDIWSLGCVFLELLIWAVFDFETVKKFAREREDRRYPDSKIEITTDDAFWQMAEDGRAYLRKSVNQRMELLRKYALQPEWHAFMEVLDLVSRMLEVDRPKRISALDLWDTLDRIYDQRKMDLTTTNGNSLRDSSQDRASSPLPRLSLKAPDRRSPEPPLSRHASPLNTHVTSLPNRQVGTISGDLITSSPTYSPLLSRGRHRRNSSTNEI